MIPDVNHARQLAGKVEARRCGDGAHRVTLPLKPSYTVENGNGVTYIFPIFGCANNDVTARGYVAVSSPYPRGGGRMRAEFYDKLMDIPGVEALV